MYGREASGSFDYDMSAGSLDVWSNKITQIALDQRARGSCLEGRCGKVDEESDVGDDRSF